MFSRRFNHSESFDTKIGKSVCVYEIVCVRTPKFEFLRRFPKTSETISNILKIFDKTRLELAPISFARLLVQQFLRN